ncbi:MAG: ATP-dependent nuclease [Saprospiraceae bacterium]
MISIKKIHIKNFKSFKDVTIHCNPTLNVFTGVNNAGKTTALEAISLWLECFNTLIYESRAKRKNLNIDKGDFVFTINQNIRYKSFEEVSSVRSPNYDSVFHNLEKENTITISLTFQDEESTIEIPFEIKGGKGMLYEFKLKTKTFDYKLLNTFFKNFPYPINLIYSSPIAALKSVENFVPQPRIEEEIRNRNSTAFLRNRLINLYNNPSNKYQDFLKNLNLILSSTTSESINFYFLSNFNTDVKAIVKVKLGSSGPKIDLSLVGSGTLQIIEILLAIYQEKNDFNIILLDEPDSHIHRDIQKRLLKVLVENVLNTQIFATTHNESLIRSLPPSYLFHLQAKPNTEYYPIIRENKTGPKRGLQPSHHIKILESLGSESALDFVNAMEADKLILVEGRDDGQYIQTILDNKYLNSQQNIMYWSFGGIDEIFENITVYQKLFEQIKNGKTLWDKSILIFDSDFITDTHRQKLATKLKDKLGIPVYIWSSYTIESSVLTEVNKFILLLSEFIKNRDERVSIQINNLQDKVLREIEKIALEKVKKLEQTDESIKIYNLIKNKRDKLDTRLKIKKVFESDAAIQPNYINWAKQKLNANQIEHLATKDDVHQIIKNVMTKFGLTLDEDIDRYFTDFIKGANTTLWFSEWDKMIDVVESNTSRL